MGSRICRAEGSLARIQLRHLPWICVLVSLQFWLAYNGNDEPFQPMTVSKTYVLDQFANQNSVSTSSLNYDFAVVLLSSPMGSGAAQLAIAAGSGQRTWSMQTAGYPGEAGHAC